MLAVTPLSLIAKPASARGIRRVLERMRERLHPGRDTHALKRPEVSSEAATQHDSIQGKREIVPPAAVTLGTGSINAEAPRSEATNSRNPLAEKTALPNGLPSAESDRGESDERADNGSRPVKPG